MNYITMVLGHIMREKTMRIDGENYIPFDERKTMTKKAWKVKQIEGRKTNGFNTGERMFESKKKPSRAKSKRNFQKELDKALNQ